MTGLLRVGNTVGAAITSRRALGPPEVGGMFIAAALLLCMALVGAVWPRMIAIPAIVFAVWVALALLFESTDCISSEISKPSGRPLFVHTGHKFVRGILAMLSSIQRAGEQYGYRQQQASNPGRNVQYSQVPRA